MFRNTLERMGLILNSLLHRREGEGWEQRNWHFCIKDWGEFWVECGPLLYFARDKKALDLSMTSEEFPEEAWQKHFWGTWRCNFLPLSYHFLLPIWLFNKISLYTTVSSVCFGRNQGKVVVMLHFESSGPEKRVAGVEEGRNMQKSAGEDSEGQENQIRGGLRMSALGIHPWLWESPELPKIRARR